MIGIYDKTLAQASPQLRPLVLAKREQLQQVEAILTQAAARPAQWLQLKATPGQLRLTELGQLRLVSWHSLFEQHLGIFAGDLKCQATTDELGKKVEFSARLFTAGETAQFLRTADLFEPLLGDTTYLTLGEEPAAKPESYWLGGMHSDELFYERYLDPLVIQTVHQLPRRPGEIICDPACGSARLTFGLARTFSAQLVVASDLHYGQEWQKISVSNLLLLKGGDARSLNYLAPGSVALFVLSGLINRSVVDRPTADRIVAAVKQKLRPGGHIIITGKTEPLYNGEQLAGLGFKVILRTRINQLFFPFYLAQLTG